MTEPEPLDLPIDGQLDLHTFRPQEIRDLLHEYLDACRERDVLEVRIIHGKGTGTLRRIVHSQLGRRDDVIAYRLAPDASGWGATVVTLAPNRP